MIISKRKYYCIRLLTAVIVGVLILIGALIANRYYFQIKMIDKICIYSLIAVISIIAVKMMIAVIASRGIKNYISKKLLLSSIEDNLISIGAYMRIEKQPYVVLPKIKIKKGKVRIKLCNLKIRTILQRYLDSFSTALPERYIVEDYYITQNNAEVVIIDIPTNS